MLAIIEVSEYTFCYSLRFIWLRSCRVLMLNLFTIKSMGRSASELDYGSMKKVAKSTNACFPLYQGQLGAYAFLTRRRNALKCTMDTRQADKDSVKLWKMFCWESFGSGIHVVNFTCTTYLNTVADQVHLVMPVAFVSKIMHPATLQNCLGVV